MTVRDHKMRPSDAFFGVVLAITVAAGVVTGIALNLLRAYETELWIKQLNALSLGIAEETERNFDVVHNVLESMVEHVERDADEAERFRPERLGGEAMHRWLAARIRGLAHIENAILVSETGDIVASSRAYPPLGINVNDREYFKALRSSASAKRHVDAPVRSRRTGEWTIVVGQRIQDQGGEFRGIALVTTPLAPLLEHYERIGGHFGPGTTLNLYREDFVRLARWPHSEDAIGKSAIGGSAHTSVVVKGLRHDLLQTSAETTGMIDTGVAGQARMVATRVVDHYPLVVSISVVDTIFLTKWRDSRNLIVVLAVLSLLGLLAAGLFLRGLLQRREVEMAANVKLRIKSEAANIAKDRFLSSVTHELRTPLNVILGFSRLLEDDRGLSQDDREMAAEIARAGERLLGMVSNLLVLANIESGDFELAPRPIIVGSIPPKSLALLRSRAESVGVALRDGGGDAVESVVVADPVQLQQALDNLVSNAVKFNRRGGSVRIECNRRGRQVRISVADTGLGIGPEKQSRLFSPFDRLEAEAGTIEGSGIGLLIAKRLVEAMGGSIGFESTLGKGSRFWIDLPLAPQ